jgi:hypothetical protein
LTERKSWALDIFLLAAIAAAMIWPIFKTKYYENWMTIDSTFIADGRFLSENLPHPGWQPLWYGGTRFDFVYPPALRYGTAVIAKITGFVPAKAYHVYTGFFYCLGIAFVYVLVRTGSRSRLYGYSAALAAATVSPALLFMLHIRADAYPNFPQRLNVLVRYGEGPHITAFAILPVALALAWHGLRAGQTRWLAGSAIACAAVVSNNFYGATSLAIFFPILCWAVFTETRDWKLWLRAAAIALLAYGLCALWLSPAFLRITSRNLALVSQPGNLWSIRLTLAVSAIYVVSTWLLARRGVMPWTIFVFGSATFFSLNTLGHYYLDFRVAGEPERLVPELDLTLILLCGLGLYALWQRFPAHGPRIAIAAVALVAVGYPGRVYIAHPWKNLQRTSEYKHRMEFQLSDWVAANRPDTRSQVTGTVRFWWNVWSNNAQIGGGSEQGLTNIKIMTMFWRIVIGEDAKTDILWLQAFGVDNLVVNDKTSVLPICDYTHPHKYIGALPVLWENGKGDWIYAVPRKHPGLARVVDTARLSSSRFPSTDDDIGSLQHYVDTLERSAPAAAQARWLKPDTLEVAAETAQGQSLVLQVAFDPSWHARENGHEYKVSEDAYGQVRIDLPPGQHKLELHFDTPLENQIGRGMTLLSIGIAAYLLARKPR